jgi:hypothetical protein
MADHIYAIATERFGVVLIVEDSIAAARRRARRMFGVGARSVHRETYRAACPVCDSRPCCCPPKEKPDVPASA